MLTRDWMDCDEPPRSFRERGLDPYSRGPWPPERCRFYLGAHRLNWLWRGLARGPLFVNVHLMLSKSDERKANFGAGLFVRPTPLERATVDIGLDSGGYTELKDYGLWRWSAAEHVWLVRRMFRELGRVDFAAPQDWPCGDETLRRTGLSVVEHQERTLRAYLEMMRLAPEIPWAPVLQGGAPIDFLRHVEAYQRAGIDLWTFQRVLLGSIAYRDDDPLIYQVVQALQRTGIALHALGAKEDGLSTLWQDIFSADSLAWSTRGRKRMGNLKRMLGLTRKIEHADLVALVEAAPPKIRDTEDARLLLLYGREQDLANAQGYAEHWHRQLALLGESIPPPYNELRWGISGLLIKAKGKLTPHNARLAAEAQVRELAAKLAALGHPVEVPLSFAPTVVPFEQAQEMNPTPWLKLNYASHPARLECICGEHQELPYKLRANAFEALAAAFREQHLECGALTPSAGSASDGGSPPPSPP